MLEVFRRNHFFWRRLHSLTGIVPIGGFLLFHLYTNWIAWAKGPQAYDEHVRAINNLPGLLFLEIFLIILPLYFHAFYGIYIAMDARYSGISAPHGRQWPFFWQRISGLITLAFVTQHLYHFRLMKALGAGAFAALGAQIPTFEVVRAGLQNPFMLAWYALGVIAASYHLFNGIYTFLITWGITIGPKSQRISNLVTNVGFVALSAMGILALAAFR